MNGLRVEGESPEPVRNIFEARESVRVSLALKFADVAQQAWSRPFPLVRAFEFSKLDVAGSIPAEALVFRMHRSSSHADDRKTAVIEARSTSA